MKREWTWQVLVLAGVLAVAGWDLGRAAGADENKPPPPLWSRGEDLAQVYSVVFSPDGKTLASGSTPCTIKLREVATGKELATLKGHTDGVTCVAFSPDGKTLASGSYDSTIKLWEVATGKERATLKGHTYRVLSVAFSPDGKTLASGSAERKIKLWEVATGKPADR